MTPVTEYKRNLLARRAAKAGVTVDELVRLSTADADRTRRLTELRGNRRSAWQTIAANAAKHGRSWGVSW